MRDVAVYRRRQPDRPGAILLLLGDEGPLAFVKVRRKGGVQLARGEDALRELERYAPRSFQFPKFQLRQVVGDWEFLAMEPLPPLPHRPPRFPPVSLIAREIQEALADLPKPPGTPEHWLPMHGDLTPWNLRLLGDGNLALVDWEDAGWGPPGADEVLYRASVAALEEVQLPVDLHSEAITYWASRRTAASAKTEVDRRLLDAVSRRWNEMRPPTGSKRVSSRVRPRIIVYAYAVEPGRGSEPEAGWGVITALSKIGDCTVLYAPEHSSGIRRWSSMGRDSSIQFKEVQEVRIARHLKFHRIPWFLMYVWWLRRAARVAEAFHADRPFDIAHHATYATYWLPTPATQLRIPSVWGPVGGAVTTPLSLWRHLGLRGVFTELLDLFAVRLAALAPGTRRTWRQTTAGLIQNEETLGRLPHSFRRRCRIVNHAWYVEARPVAEYSGPRGSELFWAGVLESRKGLRLAIRALALTPPDVRLIVAGAGPELRSVKSLAGRLGVQDRVDFLGRIPRDEVLARMQRAAAFVFTGLREEGGMALAEAMALGTPVVVLANGGGRTVAAATTDPSRVWLVYPGPGHAVVRRMAQAFTEFSRRPPGGRGDTLDRERARALLEQSMMEALGTGM